MKLYPQEVYLHGLGKFPDYVYSVDISWSGRGQEPFLSTSFVVTGGADSIARVWTIENFQLKIHSELQGHSLGVNCVRFSPDGSNCIATGSDDGKVVIWRPVQGENAGEVRWIAYKVLNTLDEVTHVSWSACGQMIACSAQREMSHLYNIHTGRALQRLDGHNNRVLGVAWDPRGQLIVSQSTDRTARVYARSKRGTWYVKAQLKEVPLTVNNNGGAGEGLSSSPTNALTERKWKLFISESHYPNDPTAHFFRRGEFSPDGSMVILPGGLSNPDETNGVSKFVVQMFNRKQLVTNNGPTAVFTTPCSPSITVRFHPRKFKDLDGNFFHVFAVTTATSFYVMRSDKPRPVAFGTDIHCTSIVDAAWSSDATKLVLCSTDGYVTLVEFAEGELGGVPDWTETVLEEQPAEEIEEEKMVEKIVDSKETEDMVACPVGDVSVGEKISSAGSSGKRRITPVVVGNTAATARSPTNEMMS